MNPLYFGILIFITIFLCCFMQKRQNAPDAVMWFGNDGLGLTEI